ncbi:hypothetical protein C2857_003113 [Epichloe festucae Fl1]|uniref:Methyl transferase n=1 Tax=Epichloe festucae (strain Fl1) TaxID=877507 RepID=A0A7S9PTI9_EPIFF|nr:hypothetical protein C2857_003113 [Epichloe festucae Fl1]
MSLIRDSGPRRLVDGFWEYGRYYGSWRPRKYLFPIDAEELNRMDIFHKFFLVARDEALFASPLDPNRDQPLRILDLGTGTGIWAINVAEVTAVPPEIMVVDLHQIQPALIPLGISPLQFDIEEASWEPLMKDCDLVHIRMLYGSIQTDLWPDIYQKTFEHLKPGSGYIEHIEIDWVPRWDGNDVPPESSLHEWSQLLLRGLDRFNRNARIDMGEVRITLDKAGFVDFREETIRCYVNPWSSERREREIARWFNLGLSQCLEAMSLMPMIEGLSMTKEQVKELCDRAKKEICILRYHAYMTLHIWSARRPSI